MLPVQSQDHRWCAVSSDYMNISFRKLTSKWAAEASEVWIVLQLPIFTQG